MSYLTERFKFRVESDASSSYIVLELRDTQKIQDLQMKMIEQNPNPLILPLSYRMTDNQSLVYYNVTSKVSLKQFLIKRSIKKSAFIDLLLSMIKILTECKNYYAYDKNFAVDEDLIYVNPGSCEVSMMYIPVEFEVDFKAVYKEFVKRVMDNLVQIDETNELGFMENIRMYLREDSFNLQEFQVLLSNFKTGSGRSPRYESEDFEQNYLPHQPNENEGNTAISNMEFQALNQSNKKINTKADSNAAQPSNPKKSSFVPSPPVYTNTVKERYPLSSFIIAAGLQVFSIGLIALAYIFYISKQADQVGPLGGMLLIFAALDFLVLRKVLDKSKKVSCAIQVKQKQVQSKEAVPAKPGTKLPSKTANTHLNSSKTNDLNIPGAKKTENPANPVQKQKQPKIPNMNKRQIENIQPPEPDFSGNSPYDIGNTILLSQQDHNSTVIMDAQPGNAYLARSQDGVTQKIDITSSNFIIGRVPGHVSYILENKNISKIHAAILVKDGKYFVKDLGSSNGTYLNAKKIENGLEYEINDRDKIRFAALEYEFKVS